MKIEELKTKKKGDLVVIRSTKYYENMVFEIKDIIYTKYLLDTYVLLKQPGFDNDFEGRENYRNIESYN